MTDKNLALIEKLDEVAQAHKATISQVALAWIMTDEVITSPIISATSPAQLEENLGALEVTLSEEEKKTLDDLTAWE